MRVLIVDDEESIRYTFSAFLSDAGHTVQTAGGYDEAMALTARSDFDLIVTDLLLEGRSGLDILREVRERGLRSLVMVVTGYPSFESACEALRFGAFDYLVKPLRQQHLLALVEVARRRKASVDAREMNHSCLESILENLREPVLVVDKDLVVLKLNEAAITICGLPRDAVGRTFGSVPKQCSGRCIEAMEEAIRKRQPVESFKVLCHPGDNRAFSVDLMACPIINGKGNLSGVVKMVTRRRPLPRACGTSTRGRSQAPLPALQGFPTPGSDGG